MNNIVSLLHHQMKRLSQEEWTRIAKFYDKHRIERDEWIAAFSAEDDTLKLEP